MGCYVIVDLEMCNVPAGLKRKSFNWKSELIQIGAVLLDENLEPADTFMTLVSPEFGMVDAFIEKLTGISRISTKNAPRALEALKAFVEWLPEDAVLVSWSDNDKTQIEREIEGKNLDIPEMEKYLESWVDCQPTFSEKMNTTKIYKLSEALIISNIEFADGEHDALVDARNTAMLFAKMEREPELQLNPYYLNTATEKPAFNPFAAAFAGIDFGDGDED